MFFEKNGAGEETPTLDSHLGKVMLYQLSYTRFRKGGGATYRNCRPLQMLFLSFFERMPMHEIGENTVVAQGVCPVTKVGLYLQQTLLCGRASQLMRRTPSSRCRTNRRRELSCPFGHAK